MAVKQPERIRLGSFPTPCESAPGLGELLRVNELWVRRDDLSGFSSGGNKVRTIEFLLGHAHWHTGVALAIADRLLIP